MKPNVGDIVIIEGVVKEVFSNNSIRIFISGKPFWFDCADIKEIIEGPIKVGDIVYDSSGYECLVINTRKSATSDWIVFVHGNNPPEVELACNFRKRT